MSSVGFDLRALNGISKYRGIGMYIAEIVSLVAPDLAEDHDVVLYVVNESDLDFADQKKLSKCRIVYVDPAGPKQVQKRLGRSFEGLLDTDETTEAKLPGISGLDVFFQPYFYYGIPKFKNVKNIMVAYDLIPIVFAHHYFGKISRQNKLKQVLINYRNQVRQKNLRNSAQEYERANRVLAISSHTKDDLSLFTKTQRDKIDVTLLGPPKVDKVDSATLPEGLQGSKFIFYIGGIDYRRDFQSLIDTFEILRKDQDLRLVLAGKNFESIQDGALAARIKNSEFADDIINLGFVSNEMKQALFENAVACVYPTIYEGFGLPILEAFTYGCPIVTYNNSSIPEVGGGAALYAEDPKGMAEHVQNLIDSPNFRAQQITAGKKQVKKFSWKRCAEITLEAIEEVLS